MSKDETEAGDGVRLTRLTLTSSPAVNTPRLFRWAQCGFAHQRDRVMLAKTIADGYGLKEHVAYGLLCGEIPYTIDAKAETVEFEYYDPKARKDGDDAEQG